MSTTTSRLTLTQPAGGDPPSALRTSIGSNTAILDNSVLFTEGTLVLRPAATAVEHGHFYNATDTGQLAWSNGTTWKPFGLTPVTAPASTAAAAGQMMICNPGAITITLPTPTAGALVGVQASAAATSSAGTTITASSGAIYGVGTNGATSIPLAMPEASVVLLGTGSNWNIVCGQRDTGWVPLTFTSNWTYTSGTYTTTPSYRVIGDKLHFKGQVTNNVAGTLPAGTYITSSYPASALPPFVANLNAGLGNVGGWATGCLSIGGNFLNLCLAAGSVTQSGQISLDGLSCSMI